MTAGATQNAGAVQHMLATIISAAVFQLPPAGKRLEEGSVQLYQNTQLHPCIDLVRMHSTLQLHAQLQPQARSPSSL